MAKRISIFLRIIGTLLTLTGLVVAYFVPLEIFVFYLKSD